MEYFYFKPSEKDRLSDVDWHDQRLVFFEGGKFSGDTFPKGTAIRFLNVSYTTTEDLSFIGDAEIGYLELYSLRGLKSFNGMNAHRINLTTGKKVPLSTIASDSCECLTIESRNIESLDWLAQLPNLKHVTFAACSLRCELQLPPNLELDTFWFASGKITAQRLAALSSRHPNTIVNNGMGGVNLNGEQIDPDDFEASRDAHHERLEDYWK